MPTPPNSNQNKFNKIENFSWPVTTTPHCSGHMVKFEQLDKTKTGIGKIDST
jgi:hypothetical protein